MFCLGVLEVNKIPQVISENFSSESYIYDDIAKEWFNNFKFILISKREAVSASHNIWTGFLYVKDDK